MISATYLSKTLRNPIEEKISSIIREIFQIFQEKILYNSKNRFRRDESVFNSNRRRFSAGDMRSVLDYRSEIESTTFIGYLAGVLLLA